jgi:hypothetical protein
MAKAKKQQQAEGPITVSEHLKAMNFVDAQVCKTLKELASKAPGAKDRREHPDDPMLLGDYIEAACERIVLPSERKVRDTSMDNRAVQDKTHGSVWLADELHAHPAVFYRMTTDSFEDLFIRGCRLTVHLVERMAAAENPITDRFDEAAQTKLRRAKRQHIIDIFGMVSITDPSKAPTTTFQGVAGKKLVAYANRCARDAKSRGLRVLVAAENIKKVEKGQDHHGSQYAHWGHPKVEGCPAPESKGWQNILPGFLKWQEDAEKAPTIGRKQETLEELVIRKAFTVKGEIECPFCSTKLSKKGATRVTSAKGGVDLARKVNEMIEDVDESKLVISAQAANVDVEAGFNEARNAEKA